MKSKSMINIILQTSMNVIAKMNAICLARRLVKMNQEPTVVPAEMALVTRAEVSYQCLMQYLEYFDNYYSYGCLLKSLIHEFKDRQQEAENDSQYLTLFCSYCMHINILYMK